MLVKLKKGDEIQILAPSSFIDNEEHFIKGIDILKTWGLKIVHNNILSRKFGYFAGDDQTRFEELEKKGEDVHYQDIYNSLKKRDESDMNRDISPLKIPKNAHILDTSCLKPDAIVDKILNLYTITAIN